MLKIACFGDSLIEGFPFGPEVSWCAEAEQGANFQLLNYGVCGECCADISWRLQHTVLPEDVSGIIFLGGANDGLCGVPPEQSALAVRRAADWANRRHLHFAVVLPFLCADLELNRRLAQLTRLLRQEGYYFFDLQDGLGGEELENSFTDGVHPTVMAYRRLGQVARPQIECWIKRWSEKNE